MLKYTKPVKRWVGQHTTAVRKALLAHSPEWAQRAFGPAVNYLDMLFVDHGIFRLAYLNRHRLGQKAWRSAQPAPHQIGTIRRLGIKTIVNLRGERLCGSYWLEVATCRRLGVKLENFKVRSRAAPSHEELYGARDLFRRIEYPALLHCKSGADRAGLMSVLYMHLVEGVPVAEAMSQLSFKYGHIRQADTGVIDHFFSRYVAANEASPIDFFEWIDTAYDPAEVQASFRSSGMGNRLVNDILRRE